MHREYHVDHSEALGRQMERLVFGHGGLPVIVFPTSCGRFFEFEDNGMVAAVKHKIDRGELQLFCVDSVDSESWYATGVEGSWRIARHLQYERYIMQELLPHIRWRNHHPSVAMIGCSFGGFHAASMALRHPDEISAMLSMGGAFDIGRFLRGHYDNDCYYTLPTHFLPNLQEGHLLWKMRHNTYVLATGHHDMCWNDNERLAAIMKQKGIPVRLDVWQDDAGHDWPWWRRMLQTYL
ncbi:MAG: esterase family protein [Janthinobacterium lividum]